MTGQHSQLINFVRKFLGIVRFGNDQIAKIMCYGDYQLGNVTISRVYYVEGLKHNLFSVGQFCDLDLEVSFRKHKCYVRNLDGVDLLYGSRDINLYTISKDDMLKSSPICLLSKASKTKSCVVSQFSEVVLDRPANLIGLPVSTSLEEDAPSASMSLNQEQEQSLGPFRILIAMAAIKKMTRTSDGCQNCFLDDDLRKGVYVSVMSNYALEIIKKYGMQSSDPVDTPMVDKRPDLESVISGPWYSKDSCITLTAYADADHAGCQDTRRSTSEVPQFLRDINSVSGIQEEKVHC
ncbi:hypothetical protein Tco_0570801 [Tanacetum coccineum]